MSEGAPGSSPSTLGRDRARTPFVQFLRSAGRLAIARQAAAVALLLAVLALPSFTSSATTTQFVWGYFAMLSLTSLFGFGLERLAGVLVATRVESSVSAAIGPLVLLRLVSLPLVPIGMGVLFAFVGVSLPPAAWVATFVWVVAGLIEPIAFGGLRAAGDASTEPCVLIALRFMQAGLLIGAAALGAPVAILLAAMAVCETLSAVVALRRAGPWRDLCCNVRALRTLPRRQAVALTGIDVVALGHARADVLLCGRILGAATGALYGLAFRVVDGFSGLVGSVGLWLYAESVNERDGASAPDGIRARSLALLPRLAVGFALVVFAVAALIGSVVPKLAGDVLTIRVLAAAFPLITINSIEAHIRSGHGRNREMLTLGSVTLGFKVLLATALISEFGLPGAAVSVVLAELLQSLLLTLTASHKERRVMARPLCISVIGATAVVGAAAALDAGANAFAGALIVATVGMLFVGPSGAWLQRRVRAVEVAAGPSSSLVHDVQKAAQ